MSLHIRAVLVCSFLRGHLVIPFDADADIYTALKRTGC